jgi:hypothetical protein
MARRPTTSERRERRPSWAWLGAALLLVALVGGSAVGAQEPPPDAPPPAEEPAAFAVQPSGPNGPGSRDWFVYTLDPGSTFGDTVAISNLSDRSVRFAIYATDAVGIADVGGFSALRDDETPTDVGTWITLAANEYVVEPGTRIDVPFSITVPADAEPGDHAGAILAVDADAGSIDPESAGEGISFDVRQRIGARVYVRVNGTISPALRIDELDVQRNGDGATVTWEVSNTGNLRLSPTAQVRITGLFGRTVRTAPLQELPELLPGGNFIGGTPIADLPSLEPLTAHLVIEAEGVEVERSKVVRPFPWLVVGIAAIVALGIAWFIVRRRRSRRGSSPPPPAREADRVPTPV